MAEHENSIGESDEWYTPPEMFAALNCEFDLDPCSPGKDHRYCTVPAKRAYTKMDDGLLQQWSGFVFMNPPYGGRNGHVPWIDKFLDHGNGIALVRSYTSAGWFHDYAVNAEIMLFPRGKTKFIRPDGSVGKSPGHGVVLLGVGLKAIAVLKNASDEIGWIVDNRDWLYQRAMNAA